MADASIREPGTADAQPVAPPAAAPKAAPPDAPGPEEPAPAAVQKSKRKPLLIVLAVAVVVAAIGYGVYYWLTTAGRVETDNAYVAADTAQITALVPGPVLEVRVANTQMVRRGDILVVLDPADAKVDVATAAAALVQARQGYTQAVAQATAARARLGGGGAGITEAQARLTEANATIERTGIELSRRQALVGAGAVSGEELTTARAAYASAVAGRQVAQAGIASAQAAQSSSAADLKASEAVTKGTTIDTAPDVKAAQARLDAAKLSLQRTTLRAPIDGIVTNKQVQIGQRIAAGAPIMTLVPVNAAYVDANFKESQLSSVHPGMPVELTSDFYGSKIVFHGRVVGFAGGTGAAFALIPAQNATGNWVKVVQRLPVRISLDPRELRDHPLRVGLSMTTTIDTRGR